MSETMTVRTAVFVDKNLRVRVSVVGEGDSRSLCVGVSAPDGGDLALHFRRVGNLGEQITRALRLVAEITDELLGLLDRETAGPVKVVS